MPNGEGFRKYQYGKGSVPGGQASDVTLPTPPPPPSDPSAPDWWKPYENVPGFQEWLKTEKNQTFFTYKQLPAEQGEALWQEFRAYTPPEDVTPEETDPNAPEQVGDKWIDSAGNLWASSEEAYASNVRIRQLEEKRLGRMADYERRFTEYEELIAKGTVEDKALAQRLAARTKGELKRDIRSVMYGMGETLPEGFEERLEESSTRNLLDMMSNIEQRNIAHLTAAKQFQIGTSMSLEQIGMQETGLEKQMYQYLSSQAQQQSQFESGLGFQQAEMALRKELGLGQLDLGRDQLAWQRQYGGEELDIMQADVEGQPQWWERLLSTGAQIGGTVLSIKMWTKQCFDVTTPVISQNGFIPIGMLKQGDMISTTNGYRPVKRVHQYNNHSTLNIDGMKVTEHHPYIIENGDIVLSGDLKVGNKLWGGKAIKSIEQEKGSGRVFNIDIDGNTFHLGNATLVHTGRNKNGV